MKKLVFIGLLLLLSVYATAQNANADNFQKMVDFLPPAPNASAIIKHGDITLNKNTGSPAINIPLYTVKGNKIAVGVSLGYSSTGIKVDEIASRTGMGWVLNAGGVITRTVRGWADDKTARITPYYPNADYNCATYNLFEKVTTSNNHLGGYDAEPDLYNFNMNGISGSFVFSQDEEAILIPAEKYKVEKDWAGSNGWNFKITATDGIAYYFGGPGATELTKRTSTCGKTYDDFIANAWYLVKVEHPNGEIITLSYSALTYTYETGSSETRYYADLNYYCTITPGSTSCVNMVTTQGVLLTGITSTSNNNGVVFTYGTRQDCTDKLLSTVTQLVNGQPAGTFNLTYDQHYANMSYNYVSSARQEYTPYLTQLTESSSDLAFSKTHKFEYNDPGGRPPRLSYSQDHWGYFNGRINTTLIPKPSTFVLQQRFPAATANREADSSFAGKGLLSKIVYPTGGVDKIDYEGNTLNTNPVYQTYHEYNCAVTGTASTGQVIKSATFTIDGAQMVELDINYTTTLDPSQYDAIHMQGTVEVDDINGTPTTSSFPMPFTPGTYVIYANPSWNLPAGTYTLKFSAKGSAQTNTIKLKFLPQSFPSININKVVGGMRVKRVTTGNPNETPMVKRYYYGAMDNLGASSLMPIPTPVYSKDYVQSNPPAYNYFCNYTAMYSGSLNNLYNYGGAPISYAYMTESIGENFEGGAIQSKFYAGGDVVPELWWGIEMMGAPLSNWSSPLNGKLSEEVIYKKPVSGSLFPIKKTQYIYSIDDRLHNRLFGYTINQRFIAIGGTPPPALPCANPASAVGGPNDSPINQFDAMRYKIDSWWAHLDTQTETNYDENGQNPVTTVTSNYYDNVNNLQPTKSETVNSKGELTQRLMTYPHDYVGNNIYDMLIGKNIITPVIDLKTQINNTTPVAEQKTNYGIYNFGSVLPQTVQNAVKGNSLVTEGSIDVYDNNENILQFTNKAGISTAIIWGYNNQYPVAQVVGSTYANAIAQLTGGSVTALQTMDGTALQTELNRIRTGIPSASVTTYTYKHLTGVTSITDPNNKTNTYDYDSFNRLLSVKDQDGNVVKKNEYVYATPNSSSSPTIYFNDPQTINVACQTCLAGYAAAMVQYYIPFGKYYSLVSVADANAKALADPGAQEYANTNGKCLNISCGSTATCTNCTGNDKKCINGVCETGIRVNVSTYQFKSWWVCTYYYHFSDNTTYPAQAPYLTENNSTPCSVIEQ